MKRTEDTTRTGHSAAADIAAFCGMAVLGGAGALLLMCDVSEDAPHWMGLLALSKLAGMAILAGLGWAYRRYTGRED